MGFEPLALNTYKTVTTSGYIGSMYNFCANPKPACLRTNPDLTIARLPQSTYTMTYVNGGVSYKGSAINANSTGYMMFMCGDQPFTHIKTDNTTGRSLLIFKESYGNAFAPYMIDYYDQVVVVDNRYNTKSVAAIIQEYGITDALIINNIQASNDSNQINWLKKQIAS